MKRSRHRVVKRVRKGPVIGDMIFSMLTLPFALGVQDIVNNSPDDLLSLFFFLPCALICMGIARLFRSFRFRAESDFQFYKYLVYSIIFICSPLLMIPLGATKNTMLILSTIHWSTLVADCVISCIRNHRLRNIVLNLIILFLLISLWIMFIYEGDIGIIEIGMFIAAMQALVSIMSAAFARIKLKVLRNVIRGTYAAEVMLGLLLLILSFSYCLTAWEPNIPTFSDAIWYCFAIVTTIGFGDIAAVTLKGRILSIILGMYGIIVVSLITSIIVNFYSEMKQENLQEGSRQ